MGIEESSSAIAASTATSPAADASSKELIGNTKHASGTGGLMSPAQEITDLAPELEEEPVLVDGTASPLFLSYVEVDTDSDSEDEGEFSDEEDYDTEEETDEGEFLSCCRISPPRVPERDRSNSAAGDEGFSQKLRVFIVKVPSPANERAPYFMLYLCGPAESRDTNFLRYFQPRNSLTRSVCHAPSVCRFPLHRLRRVPRRAPSDSFRRARPASPRHRLPPP